LVAIECIEGKSSKKTKNSGEKPGFFVGCDKGMEMMRNLLDTKVNKNGTLGSSKRKRKETQCTEVIMALSPRKDKR
jgi:protoporphyrinogen oxidase